MARKPKPTQTTNPLHFEDLEPHRFEDLVRELLKDFKNWHQLEPTGKLGADDGFDARGLEVVTGISGHKVWQIQCKREKTITPKKLAEYVAEMIPNGAEVPQGVILAAACEFSKKARDVFRDELQRRGVHELYLWGRADIEDSLYQKKNAHLLFKYFGISIRGETPNFVYVVGLPLGDNGSPEWIMSLKHYGPNSAHNCKVSFNDDDRKNIEHEWLLKNPNVPYPPANLAGQSHVHFHVQEVDPHGSTMHFRWTPLNPDRQHYTVSISCRDGVFVEKWEVTRVDGVLRTRMSIEHGPVWKEKNPTSNPVIFRCEDPEFLETPLISEVPKTKRDPVHPGWKPNHRFELPVAIIDPNENVQVAGVKGLDGKVRMGPGCWQVLLGRLDDEV